MSVASSRSAEPIPGGGQGAAVGTWGLLIAMIGLGTFVAGLAAAALYLHTGQDAWPPSGIARPAVTPAVAVVVMAAGGVVAATAARRWIAASVHRAAAMGMAVSGALLAGACTTLVADLATTAFRWDVHAYTSVYWVLTAASALFLGIGVIAMATVFLQTLVGLVDEDRHLELRVTVQLSWFALVVAVVLLGLVHGLPAMTAGGS